MRSVRVVSATQGASFMGQRRQRKFRPRIERLEEKQVPSAGVAPVHAASAKAASSPNQAGGVTPVVPVIRGFTLERITQPNPQNAVLTRPINQVLVQNTQPVPGQVYNVL